MDLHTQVIFGPEAIRKQLPESLQGARFQVDRLETYLTIKHVQQVPPKLVSRLTSNFSGGPIGIQKKHLRMNAVRNTSYDAIELSGIADLLKALNDIVNTGERLWDDVVGSVRVS